MRRLIPLALVAVASSARAEVPVISSTELLEVECRVALTGHHEIPNRCSGFLLGVKEGHDWGVVFALKNLGRNADAEFERFAAFCVPSNVSIETGAEVFVDWVGRHPEARGYRASLSVLMAWREVWPCRKGQ